MHVVLSYLQQACDAFFFLTWHRHLVAHLRVLILIQAVYALLVGGFAHQLGQRRALDPLVLFALALREQLVACTQSDYWIWQNPKTKRIQLTYGRDVLGGGSGLAC